MQTMYNFLSSVISVLDLGLILNKLVVTWKVILANSVDAFKNMLWTDIDFFLIVY